MTEIAEPLFASRPGARSYIAQQSCFLPSRCLCAVFSLYRFCVLLYGCNAAVTSRDETRVPRL